MLTHPATCVPCRTFLQDAVGGWDDVPCSATHQRRAASAATASKPNRSCYNLTTILTTTRSDMRVLSRTHRPCCLRREGRQRLYTNEHEQAATYSSTAWRRFESCRGHPSSFAGSPLNSPLRPLSPLSQLHVSVSDNHSYQNAGGFIQAVPPHRFAIRPRRPAHGRHHSFHSRNGGADSATS